MLYFSYILILILIYWDSPVGIAIDYGLYDRGVRGSSPGRIKNFPWFMRYPILVDVHKYAVKLRSVFLEVVM
jgi:hypothetical protein